MPFAWASRTTAGPAVEQERARAARARRRTPAPGRSSRGGAPRSGASPSGGRSARPARRPRASTTRRTRTARRGGRRRARARSRGRSSAPGSRTARARGCCSTRYRSTVTTDGTMSAGAPSAVGPLRVRVRVGEQQVGRRVRDRRGARARSPRGCRGRSGSRRTRGSTGSASTRPARCCSPPRRPGPKDRITVASEFSGDRRGPTPGTARPPVTCFGVRPISAAGPVDAAGAAPRAELRDQVHRALVQPAGPAAPRPGTGSRRRGRARRAARRAHACCAPNRRWGRRRRTGCARTIAQARRASGRPWRKHPPARRPRCSVGTSSSTTTLRRPRAVADGDVAEHLGPGVDEDVVTDRRPIVGPGERW